LPKRAEPARGAARGPVTMGVRGQAMPVGPASRENLKAFRKAFDTLSHKPPNTLEG
jgi:hypothetical protein